MIFLLPIVGLIVGAVLAITLKVGPQGGLAGQYLAVACLAGFDTICGGVRSGLEGKYTNEIFLTGFISNIVIAFGIAYLGDMIGLDLFLAVALVLGARIFTNLSLIRRVLLTRFQDARDRKRLQALAAQAQAQSALADSGPSV